MLNLLIDKKSSFCKVLINLQVKFLRVILRLANLCVKISFHLKNKSGGLSILRYLLVELFPNITPTQKNKPIFLVKPTHNQCLSLKLPIMLLPKLLKVLRLFNTDFP